MKLYISTFLLAFLPLLLSAQRTTTTIIGTTKGNNVTATKSSSTTKTAPNAVTKLPQIPTTVGGQPSNSTPTSTVPSLTFSPYDSVFVRVENQQKFIIHKVKAGESPMLLTRFYGVQLTDIYYNNPDVNGAVLRVGQQLRIPISGRALRKHTGPDFVAQNYVPVYYRVEAGDNLFRIAKSHFNMPLEVIKARNKMTDDFVYRGTPLHIGWISRTGIPDSLHRYMGTGGALGEENYRLKTMYEANFAEWRDIQKVKKPETTAEGIACWLKGERFTNSNQLYVLYSAAPKGSLVKLENLMQPNLFVYAQVISDLPQTELTEGTIILLSANVALALGGADARLPIRVTTMPKLPKKP